ncbi:MAG: chorismate mutase [Anaerolineae bacterium]
MTIRGIRGAITVDENNAKAILEATHELLTTMQRENDLDAEDLAAAWFTVTRDLDAAFPATAARDLGWDQVPLMDAQEIPVPGSLPRCIRVLLLWNTDRAQGAVRHVYLGKARVLRPDWVARREARQ